MKSTLTMKKRATAFAVLTCLLFGLVLFGGAGGKSELPMVQNVTVSSNPKFKGVWLNYLEFADLMNGKTVSEYKTGVQQVLNNVKVVGCNAVFLHLRSHSDSLYPSKLFPWSRYVNDGQGVDYDPLAIFVALAHQMDLSVHAWVNPYRVGKEKTADLPESHPAHKLREHVVAVGEDVYYDPASVQVRQLILAGVQEILDGYDVDGIHYDDYFYPTTQESFDEKSYDAYCCQTDSPLPREDWRRCQVNLLIFGTYQLTRRYGVPLGVSPAADIRKNYEDIYADVAAWVQGGYVDYLCPQLYFGLEYPDPDFRFETLLSAWETLAQQVDLYIGLASYKVGQEDAGSDEWVNATNLLAREVNIIARSRCADGVGIYHYSSLMKQDAQSVAERANLQQALKEYQ